jgi:hypothetical protein
MKKPELSPLSTFVVSAECVRKVWCVHVAELHAAWKMQRACYTLHHSYRESRQKRALQATARGGGTACFGAVPICSSAWVHRLSMQSLLTDTGWEVPPGMMY